MKILIGNRGTGKTTKLINESAKNNYYIVCSCLEEASRIQAEANNMKLKIPLPITYREFIEKQYYTKGIKGFLIDNVDLLLYSITSVPIHCITLRQ